MEIGDRVLFPEGVGLSCRVHRNLTLLLDGKYGTIVDTMGQYIAIQLELKWVGPIVVPTQSVSFVSEPELGTNGPKVEVRGDFQISNHARDIAGHILALLKNTDDGRYPIDKLEEEVLKIVGRSHVSYRRAIQFLLHHEEIETRISDDEWLVCLKGK